MILFEAEHVYVIKSILSIIYKHIKSHIMRYIVSVHVLSMYEFLLCLVTISFTNHT